MKFKYDGKMLRTMDSVKMVYTALLYLKTSRAEFKLGRAAILQSGQKLCSQQYSNLHHFRAHVTIASRKCPRTFQPRRSFHSSGDHARLGLPTTANKAEIKSAYFSLVKKLHPDIGGDARQFNEVVCWFINLLGQTLFR